MPLILAVAEAEAPSGEPIGLGAVMLSLAVLALIAWLTYVIGQTRVRRRKREAAPQNLTQFSSDDELESKRLNGVLASALIVSGLLAIVMPVYYLSESNRQASAAETFDEIAVERGIHWYEEFQCGDCHGPDGGGGAAAFVEARSGLSTAWAAPSLNDVLYRYDEDEVRYWLVWGRQGSPMPAWGTEGGGPLNTQQLDELIAYLDSITISQAEALAQVDGAVQRELSRIEGADDTIVQRIEELDAELAQLARAPEYLVAVEDFPERLGEILAGAGTCTVESAELLSRPCPEEGRDSDRDGLSDAAELALNDLIVGLVEVAPPSEARDALGSIDEDGEFDGIQFDPESQFSNFSGSTGVPDLEEADFVVTEVEAIVRDARLAVDSQDRLIDGALQGKAFLQTALAERAYAFDFEQIAADGFDGNLSDARRAVGLYNAYCARCHTAGYSAGVAFTQEAGSGAFGPSLQDGRSVVQFPDEADHLDFIITGSENGQGYGVNGIGRGWMPGFGATLTQEDLMLIVRLERVLP
ncbi:MAG: cytochrome c [Acidimicrobiia bacterium]|nr:cytochrome c [Acidimicrobiia bacterium]